MSTPIQVPPFGESISEAIVAQILKDDGEYVEKDEEIVELETDKVNAPVLAPASGILNLTISVDDTVAIGQEIGVIAPGKREAKPKKKESVKPAKKAPPPPPSSGPSARSMPDEYLQSLSTPTKAPAPSAKAKIQIEAPHSRKRLTSLRKTIAKRLVEVQAETAMLTTFNEVDLTNVMSIRAKEKDSFMEKHQVKLGFMSFFVKAVVAALKEYPAVNSLIDGDEIVTFDQSHIGVAVSTEKGLMVPVLKNCDEFTFADIERNIAEFAAKARDGKLAMSDLSGGSFTITNGGTFGSLISTPILNPPQSAILGMHTIKKRPIALGDEVAIRPMMYLALSYDHRIIDGKEAVQFLVHIKESLEEPAKLLLDF